MAINLDRLKTGGALRGPLVTNVLQPAAPMRELVVGERVGAFEIEHEISRGGMGIVYLARRADGEFAQRVALKWICASRDHALAEALFRRERDILADLEHQGIARLIDGGRTHDGMLWFAMEYVEGDAIDRWCNRRVLPLRARVQLVRELVDVLGFAHQRLLIHRDIKPANVLVTEQGQVKLLDFGIARLVDQEDLFGSAVLTPGFASPEQWAQNEITVASDVYQVGLLLAQVTGAMPPPVPDTHITRALQQAPAPGAPLELPAEALQALPRELAAIIRRATALAPTARYPTASALGDDLQRWLDRRSVAAVGGGLWYQLRCGIRRHPWVAAGTCASLCALMVLGWQLERERAVARQEATRASQAAERARASLGFLADVLKWAKPSQHRGEPVTVDKALDRAVSELESRRDLDPGQAGEIALVLGDVLMQRRDRERARPLLERAYTKLRAHGSGDERQLAESALQLATVLHDADQRERSLALADESILIAESEPAWPELAMAARRLRAIRLSQRGDLTGALAEANAALETPGANDPRVERAMLAVLSTKAGLLLDAGLDDEAVDTRQRILSATRRVFGDGDPEVSNAAMSLAGALIRTGRFDDAAQIVDSDLAQRAELWGQAHTEYAKALNQRAFLRYRLGDNTRARDDVLRAIAIAQADPPRGLQFLSGFHELHGKVELALGRPSFAEAALRAALDERTSGASLSPDFGRRRLLLTQVLIDLGRLDDAASELSMAEQEIEPLDAAHPRRALAVRLWAQLHERAGEPARARAVLDEALRNLPPEGEHEGRDEIVQALRQLHSRLDARQSAPN